jgi:hypothetical protein
MWLDPLYNPVLGSVTATVTDQGVHDLLRSERGRGIAPGPMKPYALGGVVSASPARAWAVRVKAILTAQG